MLIAIILESSYPIFFLTYLKEIVSAEFNFSKIWFLILAKFHFIQLWIPQLAAESHMYNKLISSMVPAVYKRNMSPMVLNCWLNNDNKLSDQHFVKARCENQLDELILKIWLGTRDNIVHAASQWETALLVTSSLIG